MASKTLSQKVSTRTTVKSLKWTPIDRSFPLPDYIKVIIQKLNYAGYTVFVVGGSVRDFFLRKEIKDYDLVTNAKPEEICKVFPESITVGKAFGVIKIPIKNSNHLVEIATFRKDLEYLNHRQPRGVVFSGPYEDAMRRDFSINALYYDPKTSRILDVTGGLKDLESRVIRAIGQPKDRFKEDALRLLRAIRFKNTLGFELHENTREAISARASLIIHVSHERIREELTRMWIGPNPAQALEDLSELGLLNRILPEVQALKGFPQIPAALKKEDLWENLLSTLRYLSDQNPVRSETISWMTLLHEIGKPVVSSIHKGISYLGHEQEANHSIKKITQRLKFSKLHTDIILKMLHESLKFKDVFQMRESTLQKFIRNPHFEELLIFHQADAVATDGNLAYYEFSEACYQKWKTSHQNHQKILTGDDLIQLGFAPGPDFSAMLREVEDLNIEGQLKNKEEALEYVIKNFVT